ncbi:MAG: M28 family peptidase [Chitinophagales bacterium]|jgi:hypothetical protein|nr:M28 family peptidase [Chitinophagales bacterium]
MKTYLICFLVFSVSLQAQQTQRNASKAPKDQKPPRSSGTISAIQIADKITIDNLKKDLYILASDSLEGRETGEIGQKKAAAYIARTLRNIGVKPIETNGLKKINIDSTSQKNIQRYCHGYYQNIMLKNRYRYRLNIDFANRYSISLHDTRKLREFEQPSISDISMTDSVHFEDIIYHSYQLSKDLEKNIYEMHRISDTAQFQKFTNQTPKGFYLYQSEIALSTFKHWETNSLFRDNFFLYILDDLGKKDTLLNQFGNTFYNTTFIYDTAKIKLPKLEGIQPIAIKQSITFLDSSFWSENVLAFFEGSDKKEELVVISAHYDHLGKNDKEIYYGADDNGSGSSALLSIARAYQYAYNQNIKPRRSVLLLWMTGEERGLYGSDHYVNYPIFPLDKTVCDLNTDMIGRLDKSAKDTNYVYLIGSDILSKELEEVNEKANQQFTKLRLDYRFKYDDPDQYYYRSDHYNFAINNIPVIFYFTGIHDDYHKPSDTPDKILFPKVQKIAKLIFHTSWQVANQDQRIKLNKD